MDSSGDAFDSFLASLLDRSLRPPSVRIDARGGRRARVELGDFAGHSPYLPGDDLRFLDWKALARSGQKLLRTFDEARHRRLVLIVDASVSLTPRRTGMLRLARLWCFLALHRLDSLELILLRAATEEDAHESFVGEGPDAWPHVRALLHGLELRGRRGLSMLETLPDFGRRDRDAVVLSDFWPDADAREMMRRAAHDGRRFLFVFPRLFFESQRSIEQSARAVLGESAALPRGRVRIEDPESGDSLEVQMGSDLHRAFVEEQVRWEDELAAEAAAFGHAFLAADLPRDLAAATRVETWLPFLEEGR